MIHTALERKLKRVALDLLKDKHCMSKCELHQVSLESELYFKETMWISLVKSLRILNANKRYRKNG